MNEREEEIRADILTLRSLASLEASIYDTAMEMTGMNFAVISEKNQAVILHGLYEGIIQLATRMGDWEEALKETRETASYGHSEDQDHDLAYAKMIRQTNHLFSM